MSGANLWAALFYVSSVFVGFKTLLHLWSIRITLIAFVLYLLSIITLVASTFHLDRGVSFIFRPKFPKQKAMRVMHVRSIKLRVSSLDVVVTIVF